MGAVLFSLPVVSMTVPAMPTPQSTSPRDTNLMANGDGFDTRYRFGDENAPRLIVMFVGTSPSTCSQTGGSFFGDPASFAAANYARILCMARLHGSQYQFSEVDTYANFIRAVMTDGQTLFVAGALGAGSCSGFLLVCTCHPLRSHQGTRTVEASPAVLATRSARTRGRCAPNGESPALCGLRCPCRACLHSPPSRFQASTALRAPRSSGLGGACQRRRSLWRRVERWQGGPLLHDQRRVALARDCQLPSGQHRREAGVHQHARHAHHLHAVGRARPVLGLPTQRGAGPRP